MRNDTYATMTRETQEKQSSKWVTTNTETRKITREFYRNYTDPQAIKFMRNLGGIETVQKNYTCYGYIPVRILSTSPDRETRIITTFKFDLD